ncbi:cytokinin dehydrogenase 3-like [Tasmannia lanceolata]|uniref:cytokinin dehydrogenase 3-like n=1 Tax=Tasmannia lanceolata TaxID=3420 RepID=UPI004062BCC9
MHHSVVSSHIKVLLVLSLFSSFIFSPTPIHISFLYFQTPTLSQILDYGRIIQHSPLAVLNPKTPQDISLLLRSISSSTKYNYLTVAARGAGHSTHGQAQALDGIVIDMTNLPRSIRIGKTDLGGNGKDYFFVDADGGALWVEVLEETLKHGLTPRSWTDYLYLSVGGTLSVGGVSGQAFKYGPQICNVLEMDVVTGRGEIVTCSEDENSELFYGVLGGLGQFGIITRARIILKIAPRMVKWVRLFYNDFSRFIEDEELLISMGEVDYVEGFIRLNNNDVKSEVKSMPYRLSIDEDHKFERKITFYSIEMAIYYDEEVAVQQILDRTLSRLSFIPSMLNSLDVPYFDFLNRVRQEELKLRSRGLWDVPHPWLNVFVPRFRIKQFKDLLLDTISSTPVDGPILIYPFLRHKWNPKMSVVLPTDEMEEDIFYTVSLLRSAVPSCSIGSSCLQTFLQQNQKIIDIGTSKAGSDSEIDNSRATENGNMMGLNGPVCIDEKKWGEREMGMMNCWDGMGAKQYIPYYNEEREWRVHFGEEWKRFEALKSKFDPLNVLTPGQRIFKRRDKGA